KPSTCLINLCHSFLPQYFFEASLSSITTGLLITLFTLILKSPSVDYSSGGMEEWTAFRYFERTLKPTQLSGEASVSKHKYRDRTQLKWRPRRAHEKSAEV